MQITGSSGTPLQLLSENFTGGLWVTQRRVDLLQHRLVEHDLKPSRWHATCHSRTEASRTRPREKLCDHSLSSRREKNDLLIGSRERARRRANIRSPRCSLLIVRKPLLSTVISRVPVPGIPIVPFSKARTGIANRGTEDALGRQRPHCVCRKGFGKPAAVTVYAAPE